MNEYLVSIIVPCYNQGCYLEETLDSVLCQTYQNWECIIVNDGSIDNTADIAKAYLEKDPRFKYIYQNNSGLSSARNTGVQHSNGYFILPLDSDDLISSEYISLGVAAHENDPDLKIVYCRADLFGIHSGEWQLPEYSLERMLGRNCIFCSAIYKREDYDKAGGYKTNMKYGYEDWDFWLSILENGDKVYKIDKILFHYRVRKRSMARSLDSAKTSCLRHQIWQNHRELYSKYFLNPCETFEYIGVANSKEYKLGKCLLFPIYRLLNILR